VDLIENNFNAAYHYHGNGKRHEGKPEMIREELHEQLCKVGVSAIHF
jgi:hypothetical protein